MKSAFLPKMPEGMVLDGLDRTGIGQMLSRISEARRIMRTIGHLVPSMSGETDYRMWVHSVEYESYDVRSFIMTNQYPKDAKVVVPAQDDLVGFSFELKFGSANDLVPLDKRSGDSMFERILGTFEAMATIRLESAGNRRGIAWDCAQKAAQTAAALWVANGQEPPDEYRYLPATPWRSARITGRSAKGNATTPPFPVLSKDFEDRILRDDPILIRLGKKDDSYLIDGEIKPLVVRTPEITAMDALRMLGEHGIGADPSILMPARKGKRD